MTKSNKVNMSEYRAMADIRDKFATKRYNEKKDLTTLRHKLTKEIIELKDKVATKRYTEKVDLLNKRVFSK
jgi:hypothetical protein